MRRNAAFTGIALVLAGMRPAASLVQMSTQIRGKLLVYLDGACKSQRIAGYLS